MIDSYERFFSMMHISKEQFFDFGINETIRAPLEKAKAGWEELKQRIDNGQPVYIRGFGRNSSGSHMYLDFYKYILPNGSVHIDPINNLEPTKIVRDMTGYSKTPSTGHELIRNYQVSHVFGRTKNIYAFTAPWNIVYLPKIVDPFTGHEAKGEIVNEYKAMFRQEMYAYFEPLIEDYNELISDEWLTERIHSYFEDVSRNNRYSQKDTDKLKKSVCKELTPISVSDNPSIATE